MASDADGPKGHPSVYIHAPRPQPAVMGPDKAHGPHMLNARMSALAKLTEPDRPSPSPDNTNLSADSAQSDSWRSLLPEGDPARVNRDDTHTPEQSWRSFLSVQSPCSEADSHDMYLVPSGSSDRLGVPEEEDDECEPLRFGRRADLFVRRPSVTPIAIADAPQRLPNLHELRSASKGSGERPKLHAFAYKSSDDLYVKPLRPRSIVGVSAFDNPDGPESPINTRKCATRSPPPKLNLGPDASEEEREHWPTSSRRAMSPGLSPLSMDSSAPSDGSSPSSETMRIARAPDASDPTLWHSLNTLALQPLTTRLEVLAEPQGEADSTAPKSATVPRVHTEFGPGCESPDEDTSAAVERLKTCDTRVSMVSTENLYILSLHLPHFTLDGITVATKGFNRRTLHIIANRWGDKENDHFERRITFGADAVMSAIRARFDGEHLHVDIPRKTQQHPRSRFAHGLVPPSNASRSTY